MNLAKASSGLLYEEKFGENLSLLWDFVPNITSRVKFNQDSVEILPGEDRIEMLMPTPVDEGWVFQTHIHYAGRTATESCGFILKSITDNVAECELRGDTRDLFDYLKMELDKESTFYLKASKDGVQWRDFGNSKMLDGNKFGYYINELTQYDPLILYDCIVYKNNFITIDDIPKECTAIIYDKLGANISHKFVVKQENGKLVLDGSNMLFPIDYLKIKFLDSDFNTVRESELENVYGGDVYDFSFNVSIKIENKELGNGEHQLETVMGPFKLYAMSILNEEPYDLKDRILKVSASSSFNPGDIPVTIAETTTHESMNNLDFKKSLNVTLKAHENKNFFIKIEKNQNLPMLDTEYKFKLTLM